MVQITLLIKYRVVNQDRNDSKGPVTLSPMNTISDIMGFGVLRATPLCSSNTKPIFSALLRPLHSHPTSLFTLSPSSNPIIVPTLAISRSSLRQAKRGFRGGVVAMAAPGSLHKSEEEWRAILSREQFRILRQKGTE